MCLTLVFDFSFIIDRIQKLISLQKALLTFASDVTYFTYRYLDTSSEWSLGQSLVFTGRVASSGSNYDVSRGVFIAPVPGVYLFTATLSAKSTTGIACYILRNDSDYLVEIFSSSNHADSSTSTSVVVDAQQGDTFSIGRCSGNGQFNSYKSSFSGVLIQMHIK